MKTPCYVEQNIEAARQILCDAKRFGGPDSLACQWARLILQRAEPTIKGPLFKAA